MNTATNDIPSTSTKTTVTTVLTSVAHWLDIINPISLVVTLHNRALSRNDVKVVFVDRNSDKVIIPFLDSLGAEYMILPNNIVIVRRTADIPKRLIELGFNLTDSFTSVSSICKKIIELTNIEGMLRFYHKFYNIELHVVEDKGWYHGGTAKQIVDNLRTKEELYVKTFISVYSTLLDVSDQFAASGQIRVGSEPSYHKLATSYPNPETVIGG